MTRYINLCNYSYEIDADKYSCIYGYTMGRCSQCSHIIKTKVMEYDELLELLKSRIYVPNLKVFFGGGDNYSVTVANDIGIIVYSVLDERTTYISQYNGAIRESSGYMIFTILKNHLNRYIFADGLIPIHSAFLGIEGDEGPSGTAIIGESGAGKSTLCYRIHSDLDYKICADDLIVYDPDKRNVLAGCKEFYLKEDIIRKYGLEAKCEKRNGKYALSLEDNTVISTNRYRIIYLKRTGRFEKIEVALPSDYIIHDIRSWCRTKNEEKQYHSVESFFENADSIVSGSYHDTDEILEALRNEK